MTKVRAKLAGSSRFEMAFYWLGRTLCVGFCRSYLRESVDGLENVPSDGPYVVAPVHRSNMDTPIVAIVTKRRLRYMGKDSLWKKQPFAWMLSALGGFPVTRGSADREALKRCIEVLECGEPLVLFPEGERKFGDEVAPLFDGAAYVASKANVPILPVGIAGSEGVMPKGKKFIYPRKVHVSVGPVIRVPVGDNGKVGRNAIRTTTAELHDELQRLYDRASERVAK
ncbi:MAG: lysophospholipid acyltransferase family protein [Ilumatobacteraceae bacterium]